MTWHFYTHWIVLVIVLLVIVSWPTRRGKWLLCSAVAVELCAYLSQYIANASYSAYLASTSDYDPEMPTLVAALFEAAGLFGILSVVLLLGFVGYARNETNERKSWPGPLEPTDFDLEKVLSDATSVLRRREWTYLLDGLLINAVGLVAVIAVTFAVGPTVDDSAGQIRWTLPWIFMAGIYVLFKESISGRSPGKVLTGLQVVDAATGRPIGPGRSATRNFIFLLPLFPLVELVVANVQKDSRRLGDLLANTVVLPVRRTPESDSKPSTDMTDMTKQEAPSRAMPAVEYRTKRAATSDVSGDKKSIHISCKQCSKKYKVAANSAGKKAKCACGATLVIPTRLA